MNNVAAHTFDGIFIPPKKNFLGVSELRITLAILRNVNFQSAIVLPATHLEVDNFDDFSRIAAHSFVVIALKNRVGTK
jgi:hypothetical protein